MPSLVTKTTPDFITLISSRIVATGNVQAASQTLDLREAPGAWIRGFMGRGSTGTSVRAGYFHVAPTDNNTDIVPVSIFDMVGQGPTTAAQLGSLSANLSTSDRVISLSSTTPFAVGDTVCIFNSDASLAQWNRIAFGATTAWRTQRNHRVLNLASNSVTNLADVRQVWIPGGDIYEFNFVNESSIPYVVQLLAVVDKGETIN